MPTGDFDYLRADIAEMLSVSAYTNLPTNTRAQCDALINEAYRGCFIRPDGKRAKWATDNLGFTLPAPAATTLGLTSGSNLIGSSTLSLNSAYAGSPILIGDVYYTYAGKVASQHYLVEPYVGATASVAATFYYAAYVLPTDSIDIKDEPEVLGFGRLSPITGKSQEIRNRQWTTGDILPERGAVWWNWIPALPDAGMETGTPIWYYVDESQLRTGATRNAITQRFCVYPLPGGTTDRTVKVRASFVPTGLADGADMPLMKAGAITDTLLPIARMKIAMINRRYAGNNITYIMQQGKEAEMRLDGLDSSQQSKKARMKVRSGF